MENHVDETVEMESPNSHPVHPAPDSADATLTSRSQIFPREDQEEPRQENRLTFTVTENPPLHITVLYALQVVLSNLWGPITMVFIMRDAFCADADPRFFGRMLSISVFYAGVCTALQVTLGIRLPIVQGSSFTFIPPIFALMNTGRWTCGPYNGTNITDENGVEFWRGPVLELSGSLAVASVVQVVIGATGFIGLLMRFIGPLTVVPTIGLIGLSVYSSVVTPAQHQWGATALATAVTVLCAVVLGDRVQVPIPTYTRATGCTTIRYPVFKIFSNVFGIGVGWLLCYILTLTDSLPDSPSEIGYFARTDVRLDTLRDASWFYVPYPGHWGSPTFGVGAFIGMLAATIASVVESVGDYSTTATACQVPNPPGHAVNRGIALEGLGSVLTGVGGAAHATTSYSGNIGFIKYTGVSSRVMWQVSAVMLVVLGVVEKFATAFTLIPDPVLGAMILMGLSSLTAVTFAQLERVDMRSSRNQLVLGLSLIVGLALPYYISINPDRDWTGDEDGNQVLVMFLSTASFVGGILGFILDNILPGSRKSRGLESKKKTENSYDVPSTAAMEKGQMAELELVEDVHVYDPPPYRLYSRVRCLRFIPFCPRH